MTDSFGYSPLECVVLTATASGAIPPYNFLWSTGDTTQTITVCPEVTTSFGVVAGASGCESDPDFVTVNVIDVRCGKNLNNVLLCHVPPDNPSNVQQICISHNAVSSHLSHGDFLGQCGASKWSGSSGQDSSDPDLPVFETRHSLKNTITIFPNPNSGKFILLMLPDDVKNETSVYLYNILSEVIYKNDKIDKPYLHIDISNRPKGIYFIKVATENDLFVSKVIYQY